MTHKKSGDHLVDTDMEQLNKELVRLQEENRYLSFLVWKLSVRELAKQDAKYQHWLKHTYVSTRANDFGVDDTTPYLAEKEIIDDPGP